METRTNSLESLTTNAIKFLEWSLSGSTVISEERTLLDQNTGEVLATCSYVIAYVPVPEVRKKQRLVVVPNLDSINKASAIAESAEAIFKTLDSDTAISFDNVVDWIGHPIGHPVDNNWMTFTPFVIVYAKEFADDVWRDSIKNRSLYPEFTMVTDFGASSYFGEWFVYQWNRSIRDESLSDTKE